MAQTNESPPFTAAVVDLPPLTFIVGRASWLSPYPENPDVTIEGVDAKRDCVRDDMEHYIAKKFRRSDQHRLRKYLYEYIAWMSRLMYKNLSVNTGKTSFNNIAALGKCVLQIMKDDRLADEVLEDLFGEFHNTYPRSHRYVDNLPRIGGWTNREKISMSCP